VTKISRKAFLAGGATVVATAAAGACLCTNTGWATTTGIGTTPNIAPDAYSIGEGQRVRVDLDKVPELAPVGGSVKIVDGKLRDGLIIVRETEHDYRAASIHCTHRGVEIEYRAEADCYQCASLGGSRFALDGEKLSGFAKGPLRSYPVTCSGNTLMIQLD
jgi:Rieske Fe-S protein